jgi:hypothetical protein
MDKHEMYALLKKAAAECEGAADELVAAGKAVEEAKTEAQEAKTAAEATSKKIAEAAPNEVEIAQAAKTAASKLQEVGLLSTAEQADAMAAQIRDHKTALAKLAEVANHVTAPKLGSVVKDASAAPAAPSADEVYEQHARRHLAQING